MNISIAPEFEKFVNSKIEAGEYCSAGEVVSDALRLLAERDELRQIRIRKLNQEIQVGLDQVERGEVVSAEEAKEHMKIFKQQFLSTPRE